MQSHLLSDRSIFWLVLNKFYICLIFFLISNFDCQQLANPMFLNLVIILVLESFFKLNENKECRTKIYHYLIAVPKGS